MLIYFNLYIQYLCVDTLHDEESYDMEISQVLKLKSKGRPAPRMAVWPSRSRVVSGNGKEETVSPWHLWRPKNVKMGEYPLVN